MKLYTSLILLLYSSISFTIVSIFSIYNYMSECPFSKDILVNWVTYFIHGAIDLGITIMSETAGEYTKTEHMIARILKHV